METPEIIASIFVIIMLILAVGFLILVISLMNGFFDGIGEIFGIKKEKKEKKKKNPWSLWK